MASKKLKLILMGFLSLFSLSVLAQDNTSVYNIYDSTVIPSKGLAQQNEFMNNTYDFPAKPRNETELGISLGMFAVSSDVAAKLPTPGFAIHIRKALGYVFSIRAQYMYGIGEGLNWKPSYGYANDPVWADHYNAATLTPVYYNYKTSVNDLSIQGLFTLNNVRFHKQTTGFTIYGGAGFGATVYDTKVNALNSDGQPYDFSQIAEGGYKDRHSIRKALKAMMDKSYESQAQTNTTVGGAALNPKIGNGTLRFSGTAIAGIAFKLSNRINLALEERWTFIKDDLLDGQEWQEHPVSDPALSPNYDSYSYTSVGLNFNIGKKAVEPLWWINPLDYAYSEINNPKHMKIPPPVLPDADGDGVTDQFDREPNTPAGCPVDTHGVSLDTDGDGVPDCKDKEKITPTYCQPVDADGVGKCPEPDCCKNIVRDTVKCHIGDLPSVSFHARSTTISSDAKALLAIVASKLRNNADCSILLTGYPEASKASQALCNKRLEAMKTYLTEKEGISADRVDVNCQEGGGVPDIVDIKAK
jgi:OmpA-OmpF porin, OOP family